MFEKFLKQNNMEGFGKLMQQTHKGLSKLYDVSCEELDFLVEEAKYFSEITFESHPTNIKREWVRTRWNIALRYRAHPNGRGITW